jgi:signal transduction histidine kinase
VTQEAVQNAIKHSRASHVRAKLTGNDHGLRLTISDDGVGFDVREAPGNGLGLRSMRERLEMLGGDMEIRSRPGRGTRIEIHLPVRSQAGEAAEAV